MKVKNRKIVFAVVFFALLLGARAVRGQGSLPTGWTHQDVGQVPAAGSASFANGAFTVTGAGPSFMAGTTDAFHFAYQPLSGDGTIVARVVSVNNTTLVQAGVMVRETLNSGAKNMVVLNTQSVLYNAYRTTTGGSAGNSRIQNQTVPCWLKLVRSGSTFTAYTSFDGATWTQMGASETINMAQNAYIGLGVNSFGSSSAYSATFDNVSISTTANPAPVITYVSATTGSVGSQVVISGSGFGASQGSSEVLLNGTTATINSWSDTSITITIPAGATLGYLAVSVAPSMNDSNPVDFTVTGQPLPTGWLDEDIGQVGVDGTANYANGAFTIAAGGTNLLNGTSDGFHFVYQPLSGDGTIIARVVSVSNAYVVQAGVMIRQSLDPSAQSTMVMMNANSGIFDTYRPIAGSSNRPTQGPSVALPYWLKMVRSGSAFTGYASPDGVSWTLVAGPLPTDMTQTVYIGLAVSGESTSSAYSATFDNISVSTTANPAPAITNVSATTGSVGSQVIISGSGFGASQGNSQVLINDIPATISSWSATSITITIPTGATSGYLAVSVAPSMICSNAVYFSVTSQPLSSGWLDQDIGVVGKIGSATYANGVFTVKGAGSGVYGQTDGFHFVYQPLTTDGSIQARVVSQTTSSQAGVMIRETLDNYSAEVFSHFILSSQGSTEYMNSRTFANSLVTQTVGAIVTAPYWVRVVRSANQFSAYVSADGATWFQIGTTQTITTAQTVYVGLGVSSTSTSTLATATFDNVSIGTGSTLPNPAITGLSPASGAPGQSVTISGSGFGATQGSSTFEFNGAVAAITSWSDSQIVAVVPDTVSTGQVSVTVGNITGTGPVFTVALSLTLTDSLGNQTTYASSISGGQWAFTDAQGSGCSSCTARGNIHNQYDNNGNLVWTLGPLGNSTLYAYDSYGNITTQFVPVSAASAATTTYTYNSFGEVLTMTDPLGNVTTNTYDSNGNLLTVTTPKPNSNTAASVTQFAYNSLGELTQITDPLGRVTKVTYTAAGYIASITDPQSSVTSYQYDARGNRTVVTDAMSNQTSFAYDMGNRLTGITYPDNSTASFTYDGRGRRITSTDQNGKTTTYAYDDADRLTSVTDPAGNVTQYTYDTENNLLSITDANSHTTNFTYDAFGRVTQTTFPSNYFESYAYDANNNLTSKTDRKGQTIQYVYDALNRLTTKTYPDSTSAEYTYDLVGKISQVNDPTGTYAFAYDNMGRLIGTTTTYSFLTTPFTNSYSYDADSNRTGFTAPDSSTNTYTYDTLNRLTTLANSWAGSFGFSYDALSRRTQMTRPNGIATNYAYDKLSHLLSVLHQAGTSTIDGDVYTLDAAGNRTAKTDDLAAVTSNYTYDKIYELTQVMQGTNTTESYSYDPVGNRQSSLNVASYSYNTSNELTSSSSGSYTYDANGNTLTDAVGRSYAWDFENRLKQVTLPNSGGTVTFLYDPFGRRIQKVYTTGANPPTTTTTDYLYDGHGAVDTINQNGNLLARYAQGEEIDEHLAESVGGATYNYEQDGVGSITSLTNASGAVAQTYAYDSFGNTTNSSGSVANPFRFTGRDFDSETGLYYYRARYFDALSGRFLSEDPLGFRVSTSFYPYVLNRPTILTDPAGTQWQLTPLPPPQPPPGILPGISPGEPTEAPPEEPPPDVVPTPAVPILTGLLDAWLLHHDWNEFRQLCGAYGWSWCTPSPNPNASPAPAPQPGQKCGPDREKCEIQWENDNSVCRILPTAGARARCYQSANQRLGDCVAGRPERPLITW